MSDWIKETGILDEIDNTVDPDEEQPPCCGEYYNSNDPFCKKCRAKDKCVWLMNELREES